MLFILQKIRLRAGSEGKIARWVGETYIRLKNTNPSDSESDLRIKIVQSRYQNGEIDSSNILSENTFFNMRIVMSDCLLDIAVAIIRHEVGTSYENDPKKMRLMNVVIFEELIKYDIPRHAAMTGQ
jgi:hypothetical protein